MSVLCQLTGQGLEGLLYVGYYYDDVLDVLILLGFLGVVDVRILSSRHLEPLREEAFFRVIRGSYYPGDL